jgi:hypothetical protein
MQSPPQNFLAIVGPLLVVVVILVIRGRRMTVKRPLKPNMLWIMPAVFLGLAAMSLAQFPPHGLDYLWLAIALVLGAALGWQRGRLMKIWIDPDTGTLMSQGSGWAIVFLIVLIVLRSLVRAGLGMEAGGAITPALIDDTFVVFAFGLFGVQRIEMGLRAQRLMHDHATSGAAEPR